MNLGLMTPKEIEVAKERGRRFAARVLANDPAKRAELEVKLGVARVRERYPEVYERLRG